MSNPRMGFKGTIMQSVEDQIPDKLSGLTSANGLLQKRSGRLNSGDVQQPQMTDFSINRILGKSSPKTPITPARTSSIGTTTTTTTITSSNNATAHQTSSSPDILDLSKSNRSFSAGASQTISHPSPFSHQPYSDRISAANAKLYAQFFPQMFPAYHHLLATHPTIHSKRYFAPFVLNTSDTTSKTNSSHFSSADADVSFSCSSATNNSEGRYGSFAIPKACSRNCSARFEYYYQQLSHDKTSTSETKPTVPESDTHTSYMKTNTSVGLLPNSFSTSEHTINGARSSSALISMTTVTNLNLTAKKGKLESFKSSSENLFPPEEISYKCRICDKVFGCSQTLQAHERTHKSPRYECTDCGKGFSQLRNYKYHLSVHRGTKEFAAECPECGKTFNDKGYLSSHMKIHRNKKEYECPYCPKSFNQRVAFNMHVRIHTGVKPHKCAECGKRFSRKMLLKQHMRTHSGEKPYQCSVCGKSFADRSNMTLHHRLHSGIKPFNCPICPKAFTKKHHLKTHLNYHTGCKPYVCPHPNCNQAFSQSSNMRTHAKKCQFRPLQQTPFPGLPTTLPAEAKIATATSPTNAATAAGSTSVMLSTTMQAPLVHPIATTTNNNIFAPYVSSLALRLPPASNIASSFVGGMRMLSAVPLFASQSTIPSTARQQFVTAMSRF